MKKLVVLFILLSNFTCVNLFAGGGMVVFDPTNWIVGLDTLYSTYDQIMTSMEQLKTTYEQAQRYYQEIQSWNFENIQWDGDWDFRNEIRQATRSIDRQISNIRNLENTLTKRKIFLGGNSYSVADLVGAGDPDKNLINALDKTYNWMTNEQTEKAMAGFADKLSDKQKIAVWRKYRLSPVNYVYLGEKKKIVDELVVKVTALGMKEAVEENIKNDQTMINNIVSSGMEGEQTEKNLLQKILLSNSLLAELLSRLNNNVSTTGAAIVQQQVYDKQKTDIEKEELAAMQDADKTKKPDDLFMLGVE